MAVRILLFGNKVRMNMPRIYNRTMKNTMDDLHGKILKKFHTLCGVLSISADEKHAIVTSYGVESSADIDTHDLINICNKLDRKSVV